MSDDQAERTEPATAKRREDARRKGQVASSREVSVVAMFAAGAVACSLLGGRAFEALAMMMQSWLAGAGTVVLSETTMPMLLMRVGQDVLMLVTPFGAIVLAAGVLAHLFQTGWIWSVERLQWDFLRISPVAGVKRLCSLRALVELVKSLVKIVLISVVLYWNLKDEILALPLLLQMEPGQALFRAGGLAWSLLLWASGALLVLAAADYAYQCWQLGQDLRMAREDVKREQKDAEGDPLIRSRIRVLQRQRAQRRMMQDVPKADVVITNPTHIAVALRYDGARMAAPVVVAKGAGYVAERIRAVAAEHGVPIYENQPLARSLHKLVDLGGEIPGDLYQAVAEILALVMRARGAVGGRG